MSYQDDALRTKSDTFILSPEIMSALAGVCWAAILTGRGGDNVKRAMFYAKDLVPLSETKSEDIEQARGLPTHLTALDPDLVHGILGIFTEGCELMELLFECLISGQPIDRNKLILELGDGYWYGAVIERALGVSNDNVKDVNIAKLRKRFPDKFTVEQAVNRNTAEEAGVLQAV